MRRPLVIVCLLLSACGGAREPASIAAAPAAEADPASPELAAFDECLDGIEAVSSLGSHVPVDLVAEACAGACEGFLELAAAPSASHELILAERCGYACPAGARAAAMAAPGERGAALVDGCGADYYGLPAGQGHFLDPSWFILHRIAGWLAAMEPGLDAERRRKLATVRLDVELPLPSLPGLPASSAIDGQRPGDLLWLRGDTAELSRTPRASLRGSRLAFEGGFESAGASLGHDTAVAADADLLVATLHDRLRGSSEPFSLLVRSRAGDTAVHRVRLTSRPESGLRLEYGPASTVADLVRALDAEPPAGDAAVGLAVTADGGNEVALARPAVGLRAAGPGGGGKASDLGIGRLGAGGIGTGKGWGKGSRGAGSGSGVGTLGGLRGSKTPRVRLAKLSVSGALDRGVVRRFVRRGWARQRYCYERVLASTPTVRGKLEVRFAISAEGRVADLVVAGEPASLDAVADCSRRALEITTFPGAKGRSEVSFRIALAPGRASRP